MHVHVCLIPERCAWGGGETALSRAGSWAARLSESGEPVFLLVRWLPCHDVCVCTLWLDFIVIVRCIWFGKSSLALWKDCWPCLSHVVMYLQRQAPFSLLSFLFSQMAHLKHAVTTLSHELDSIRTRSPSASSEVLWYPLCWAVCSVIVSCCSAANMVAVAAPCPCLINHQFPTACLHVFHLISAFFNAKRFSCIFSFPFTVVSWAPVVVFWSTPVVALGCFSLFFCPHSYVCCCLWLSLPTLLWYSYRFLSRRKKMP